MSPIPSVLTARNIRMQFSMHPLIQSIKIEHDDVQFHFSRHSRKTIILKSLSNHDDQPPPPQYQKHFFGVNDT